jgi:hypothetical protein
MPIVAEIIELQTHRESTVMRMSNIEKFLPEVAYSCQLTVNSGGLAYLGNFWFDDTNLARSIEAIRQMIAGQPAEAVLQYRFEKDFVRFKMNHLGHVAVTGELFDYGIPQQKLKFGFMTDQTVLAPLLRDLLVVHQAKAET